LGSATFDVLTLQVVSFPVYSPRIENITTSSGYDEDKSDAGQLGSKNAASVQLFHGEYFT
jgi:hypothetical protein